MKVELKIDACGNPYIDFCNREFDHYSEKEIYDYFIQNATRNGLKLNIIVGKHSSGREINKYQIILNNCDKENK